MSATSGATSAAPRLLGLFAHPDDEVFCVGGTFAAASDQGAETMIVSFTHGEAGKIRHSEIASRATLGRVRAAELDDSCGELGVGASRCLHFADRHLPATERHKLAEAAVEMVRDFRPDHVCSFDQTGAHGHPDHVVMSEVSLEVCALAADAAAFRGAGPPHTPRELLQARLPQSDRLLLRLLVDWLTNADGTQSSIASVGVGEFIGELTIATQQVRNAPCIATENTACFVLSPTARSHHAAQGSAAATATGPQGDVGDLPPSNQLTIDLETDVSAYVEAKMRALEKHSSQYAITPGLFPDTMLDQLLGTEHFFHAWSAGQTR